MKQFTLQRSCIEETAYQLGVASASGDDPATVLLSDGACNEWTGAMASAVSVEEPPPVEPPGGGGSGEVPAGYIPLLMGNVNPDGMTVASGPEFTVGMMAMATLVVPDGLVHNANTIAVFEHASDGPTSRRCWLSKTKWDNTSTDPRYYKDGNGPVFMYCIGKEVPGAVLFSPGETWYLMTVNEKMFPPYAPSGQPGQNLQFGIRWYPTNPGG